MIVTVTPNTCVDKTYRVEEFTLNRVHRPSEQRTYAGGKGINVARVYREMGGNPVVLALAGGQNGGLIRRSLEEEGLECVTTQTAGESRLCIAVVDPVTGGQTEINETGPQISEYETEEFRASVETACSQKIPRYAALCGSLPPGMPLTFYRDMVTALYALTTPSVVDVSGKALELALRKNKRDAAPWMVKPNLVELSWLAGKSIESEESTVAEAHTIADSGVKIVVVTLGERGCIGLKDGVVWKTVPPPIEFVSGVGSGDSFLGAFLWSMEGGAEFPEALRLATAAGAANAEVYGSGFVVAERVYQLANDVQLTRLG